MCDRRERDVPAVHDDRAAARPSCNDRVCRPRCSRTLLEFEPKPETLAKLVAQRLYEGRGWSGSPPGLSEDSFKGLRHLDAAASSPASCTWAVRGAFRRARGHHGAPRHPTLWLPGTDHAGIATQMLVRACAARRSRIERKEIGRENGVPRRASGTGRRSTAATSPGRSAGWARRATGRARSDAAARAVRGGGGLCERCTSAAWSTAASTWSGR